MKKTIITILIASLFAGGAIAQEAPNTVIKWAPATLFTGKVTVGAEYNFSHKNSVELLVGIPATISRTVDYDDTKSKINSKAFSVLAGYRRYLGKRPMSGLYLEPYLKYLKHEGNGMLEGALQGETAIFDTKTSYEGFGVGAQLGVQFLISNRVTIDFYFLGPEANISKFSSSATDVASNIPWSQVKADEAERDIKEVLEDIPLIGDKTEVTVDQIGKTVTTKYDGFLPGFRFGISIGVRL
jgi:hypothetical protein